jgi:hypothetical protein
MMSIPLVSWKSRLASYVRGFGPYIAIGLLVPGGLLILLSLWFYRHRRLAKPINRSPQGGQAADHRWSA